MLVRGVGLEPIRDGMLSQEGFPFVSLSYIRGSPNISDPNSSGLAFTRIRNIGKIMARKMEPRMMYDAASRIWKKGYVESGTKLSD